MTLRLTDEADAALTRLAKAQGISKNEAALRAIIDREARIDREELLESALADTLSRYSSSLKRLGE
jgi:predicted transcriptional regulator